MGDFLLIAGLHAGIDAKQAARTPRVLSPSRCTRAILTCMSCVSQMNGDVDVALPCRGGKIHVLVDGEQTLCGVTIKMASTAWGGEPAFRRASLPAITVQGDIDTCARCARSLPHPHATTGTRPGSRR